MRHLKISLIACAALTAAFAMAGFGGVGASPAGVSPEPGAPGAHEAAAPAEQTASLLVPRRVRLVIRYERVLVA